MAQNPYASFLGSADARETIASTPPRLRELVDTLGPDGCERVPAPGKWNARQILAHLADCEIVFAFRLRQALAEDNHVIQPFDQDRWAAKYETFDIASAFAVFAAVRNWNLPLVDAVSPQERGRKLTHPERG